MPKGNITKREYGQCPGQFYLVMIYETIVLIFNSRINLLIDHTHTHTHTHTHIPMFIATQFTIPKIRKIPNVN